MALEATKFSEITRHNSHYVLQGHSMSPISAHIESVCHFYVSVTVTCLLSCMVSKIWRIIGPIFAVDRARATSH